MYFAFMSTRIEASWEEWAYFLFSATPPAEESFVEWVSAWMNVTLIHLQGHSLHRAQPFLHRLESHMLKTFILGQIFNLFITKLFNQNYFFSHPLKALK